MNMKKCRMLLLFPVLLFISCEKFLDVTADSNVIQEDLFKNGNGFRMAVNGLYRELSGTDLYGRNLTWGFISGLGGNYQITTSLSDEIRFGAEFEWRHNAVINATEQIWKKGYNVIANVNNIIQAIEPLDSTFFEFENLEKNLILGEMYGLRAMVHFDLARVFSPAPVSGYTGATIPYVTEYPDYQPVPKSMNDLFAHIAEDMEKAKSLLAPIDTITLRNVLRVLNGRIRQQYSFVDIIYGDFFNYRAQRMNFFAATASLARIYLYSGDYDKAYENAKIVYDYQKAGWFTWTPANNQGQNANVDLIDPKRPPEIILTFSNNRNYDNFDAATGNGATTNTAFRINAADILFAGDFDDFRRVGWYNRYGDQRYLTWMRPRGTSVIVAMLATNQGPLLPVIRFTEMYHILIECLNRQERVDEAVTILNDLRINRGAKESISTGISSSELTEILVNDIIRETLTEGQTFFMFKRLNMNIFYGGYNRQMAPSDWYAPIPPSEIDYQL